MMMDGMPMTSASTHYQTDRALPALTFTAYTGWSSSSWGGHGGGNFNLADDATIIRSNHTWKTGFFYTHDRWDRFGQHRPNGSFNFSYQATGVRETLRGTAGMRLHRSYWDMSR